MATPLQRIQAAWATAEPLALHREVERLAAEGHTRQTLEDALEVLLQEVRIVGADDETEEIINGVWDRLTGWCHASNQITARSSKEKASRVDLQINDPRTLDPASNPSALS